MKYLSLFSGIGGFEIGIIKAYDSLYKKTPKERNKILQRLESMPNGKSRALWRGKSPTCIDSQTKNEKNKLVERAADTSSKGDSPKSESGGRFGEYAPTCIGFSEIDKYAIQIYEKHFPEHKALGNITTIVASELPDFDLLVGGFPCQAFSIAGKRLGFDDTRGTLFFDIARILKEKHPRNFILENVKGLLSHDNGRTFKTIISTLVELGYCCEWQVLNAKNFGVPQNRERVFIVGHLGGIPGRKVFPIGETETATDEGFNERDTEVSSTLRSRYGNGTGSHIEVVGTLESGGWEKRHEQIRRVHGVDGISPTIPTGTGGGVMTKIAIPVLTPDRPVKRQNGRRFKTDGEPSFTLTGQDKHGVSDGMKIRRLTPTECCRLMAYPDNWVDGLSDTQKYKVLGNGIVSNVVAEVVKRLYF